MSVVKNLAIAIANANPDAGYVYDHSDNDVKTRANRLIEAGYIKDGDPYGWSANAVATVLCEPLGGANDCNVPFNHYDNGLEQSMNTDIPGYYLEWVNSCVLALYPA